MDRLLHAARITFGLCTVFFGLEYLLLGRFPDGLPPAPPWTPGAPLLAWLLGLLLVLSGAAIAAALRPGLASLFVATLSLACVLVLHLPHIHGILTNGVDRTRAFEPLAIAGSALVLAYRLGASFASSRASLLARLDLLGRLLFALSMLVFGEQHFQYVPFIAPLIPSWIPFHVPWVYLTGIVFIAAGLAIALGRLAGPLRPLAATMLGLMLLSWVLVLHLPRCLHQPRNRDEWTSAVVALILAAGSFVIATPSPNHSTTRSGRTVVA